MSVNKNRCSGCTNYGGASGDRVLCDINIKASIDQGCASFSPDSTAECMECFYNKSNNLQTVKCVKFKSVTEFRQYCEGYASTWGNRESGRKSGCFPTNTMILTENGGRCISEIKNGDRIYSYDSNNNRSIKKVLKVNMFRKRRIWVLILSDDEKIRTTHTHSFFNGKKWVKSSNLSKGDYILSSNKTYKKILKSYETSKKEDVYNLVVEDNYTYIADNVLSHSFSHFVIIKKLYWNIYSFIQTLPIVSKLLATKGSEQSLLPPY